MALDKVSIKVDKASIKASVMDKTASYTEFQKAMEESITGGNKNQPEIFDLNQYKETEPNNKKENDELVISNDNPNYNNTLEAYIKQIKEDLGLESFEKEMNIEITSAEELIPVLEALKKNVEDNKTETAQLESIIKQLKRYNEIDQYEKSYTEQNEYTDTYTLNDTDQFIIGNDEEVPQVEGASSIEYGVIKYQDFKNYLSEKQQKIMAYIYQTKGQKEAYEYYKKLEDQINQLKGMEKAVEEYNKIKEAGKKAGSSTTTSSFENIYGGSAYGGSSRYYNAKKTSQEYMTEYMHSIVDGTVNGLEGFLASWENINNGNATELDYERMYLIEAFSNDKDLATGLEETYGFGESVGNMLPTVTAGTIISVSTGGAGAPVAAKLLQTAVTSSMIFGSSYGNKKHQNLLNGYKEEDAKKSAVVSALSETVLEKVLGTLPGVGNDTGNVLFNMIKEGGQEAVQQFAENLGDHFTLDSIDLENCLDDTAKSFVYGALISGTFEAGQQIVYHGTRIVVNSESLKKLKAAVNSKSEQQVQEVLKKMVEPSENESSEGNTNKKLKISDFINKNIVSALADNGGFVDPQYNNSYSTTMLATIDENISTHEKLAAFINGISDSTIPSEYNSVEQYKNDFINTLVNSGRIDELSDNHIFELTRDSVIFKELLNTTKGKSKLQDFYIKYLKQNQNLLIKSLDNLSVEELNQFFNSPGIKEYISKLAPNDLGEILKRFSKNKNVDWINCSVITDTIVNMNVDEFYTFLASLGYYNDKLKDILSGGEYQDYIEFLNKVIDKFYTIDNILENPNYYDALKRIEVKYGLPDEVKSEVEKVVDRYSSINDSIKDLQKQKFKKLTDFSYENDTLEIKLNNECKYYKLEVEVDGEKNTISLEKKYNGNLNLNDLFFDDGFIKKLMADKVKILGLESDTIKQNLELTSDKGYTKGLNKVKVEIDGQEKEIIIYNRFGNDSVNISSKFGTVKQARLISIEGMNDYNMKVDTDSLYLLEYNSKGKKVNKYIKPEKSNEGGMYLNINQMISNDNITDIDDVHVSKADKNIIKQNFPSIDSYKASGDIYTNKKYGGNQSDVFHLIESLANKDSLSDIESNKIRILDNLIEKNFGKIDDFQKVQLSTHYASGGCFYMSIANAFATYIGSMENGESIFREKFGFDLVSTDSNGSKSYNMEAIAFEMYLEYMNLITDGDYGKIKFSDSPGICKAIFDDVVIEYFKKRGVEVDYTDEFGIDSRDLIGIVLNNKNKFNLFDSSGFDIKLEGGNFGDIIDSSLQNSEVSGNIRKDVGAHSMIITGIDDNMNLLFSSWSKKYSLNKIPKITYKNCITSIGFSI